jgi:hypothetical protein
VIIAVEVLFLNELNDKLMKTLLLSILLFATVFSYAQEWKQADALVHVKQQERSITVGDDSADIQGFNSRTIQLGIDWVAETGGYVKLTPGLFEIDTPVRLKSNVSLSGKGGETVLKKSKGVQSPYVIDADYGELKVTVKKPEGFKIGMKIQVTDEQNSGCWNVSTAYITDIVDNVLYLDKGMIRDYHADRNGLISNASSVIEIINAHDVIVTDLSIDGNRKENFFADGCNSAGILAMRSERVIIDNVTVKDFNGEGISWQITENVSVKNCEISGSGNTGLHPGTGSPFSQIINNNVHHNDRDGLFICWRVYESRGEGNQFHHNGRFGLCTGHKDTDVLFKNNHIYENKDDGVHLRGEKESNAPHRNTFVGNVIENNGTGGSAFGFVINSPAQDLVLKNNVFKNSKKTQKAAIYVRKNGLMPQLEGNRFDAHELGEVLTEEE